MASHDSETDTLPIVEILLDSESRNTPWAAALSTARLPLPRIPSTLKAATFNSRSLLSSPSTASTVLAHNRSSLSRSHPIYVPTDIYEGEESEVASRPAVSEATPSADALYTVPPVHSLSLSETNYDESFMRGIRSASFVFNRCAPETVLDLSKMLLE